MQSLECGICQGGVKPAVRFCVAGGDLRQVYLANLLRREGCAVKALFFERGEGFLPGIEQDCSPQEALAESNVLVLPLPVTVDGKILNTPLGISPVSLEEFFFWIPEGTLLLGGKIGKEEKRLAKKQNLLLLDYLDREEMAVFNAVPTAEGAVEIAMSELPITLFGSNCLVTGFGRVGRVLAQTLKSLGAKVTVSARKQEDLAWIQVCGYQPLSVEHLSQEAHVYDVVFNTVPAVLFDRERLSKLRRDCLIIDLASKPGGVDFKMAVELGVHVIWALSLPGKVAPLTAGEIIAKTVLHMVRERGMGYE